MVYLVYYLSLINQIFNSVLYDMKSCANRYLDLYEKVHFFDEDPDQRDYGEDEASKSGRKPAKRLRYAVAGVPLAYKYQQHNVPCESCMQLETL